LVARDYLIDLTLQRWTANNNGQDLFNLKTLITACSWLFLYNIDLEVKQSKQTIQTAQTKKVSTSTATHGLHQFVVPLSAEDSAR